MDKYVINGQIGEGAQGLVLKAHDVSRDREVALKKILIKRTEDGLSVSIVREVKSLQQLKHPYVGNSIFPLPWQLKSNLIPVIKTLFSPKENILNLFFEFRKSSFLSS